VKRGNREVTRPLCQEFWTLRATGITKSYRRGWWPRRRIVRVLRGVDIELFPGEIVGLVSENGSGKSTVMKILVGAEASDAGSIEDHEASGYCPQEPPSDPARDKDRRVTRTRTSHGSATSAARRDRERSGDVTGLCGPGLAPGG